MGRFHAAHEDERGTREGEAIPGRQYEETQQEQRVRDSPRTHKSTLKGSRPVRLLHAHLRGIQTKNAIIGLHEIFRLFPREVRVSPQQKHYSGFARAARHTSHSVFIARPCGLTVGSVIHEARRAAVNFRQKNKYDQTDIARIPAVATYRIESARLARGIHIPAVTA